VIRWVFLDVGNVLLDEDPLAYVVFCRHVEAIVRKRPERTFADLLAERENVARNGSKWPVFDVAARYLSATEIDQVWNQTDREVRERFTELMPLIPATRQLIDRLDGRVGLGLIANQPVECRRRLRDLDLIDSFDVVALSEEHGLWKPDLDLFREALAEVSAVPAESLMIGDRPAIDLAPAHALGMRTAWIQWPDRAAKSWGGAAVAGVQPANYNAFVASLARVPEAIAEFVPDLMLDGTDEKLFEELLRST
jgi:FMN phosphatase YigB (HAD superfamily)